VIHSYLNGGIADNHIASNDVPLHSRSQIDPVRVANDLIIFNGVVGVGGRDETNSEITALSRIPISASPVLTEPVVA
jgi:hypothetical protein